METIAKTTLLDFTDEAKAMTEHQIASSSVIAIESDGIKLYLSTDYFELSIDHAGSEYMISGTSSELAGCFGERFDIDDDGSYMNVTENNGVYHVALHINNVAIREIEIDSETVDCLFCLVA